MTGSTSDRLSVPFTALRLLLAFGALAACVYSIILARAAFLFRQDTPESIVTAVRLVPYDVDYLKRLADWQPAHKTDILPQVIRLDPFDFTSMIQLGLVAEVQRQDIAAAERYYLQAAQVNQMYLPRWILTNFYFRRNNTLEFLKWAKAALAVSPYPKAPIFFQLWAIGKDPATNASILPGRSKVLFEYASFLVENGLIDAVEPSIVRALATPVNDTGDPNQVDERRNMAGQVEDALLNAGRLDAALRVWASLHANGWTRLPAPTLESPITNGDFHQAIFSHGFDWFVYPVNGMTLDQIPDMSKLRFTLNGTEPENCELLSERIPVSPRQRYRIGWQGDWASLGQSGGIRWRIHPVVQDRGAMVPTDVVSPDINDRKFGEHSWDFIAPGRTGIAVLLLEYVRPLGKTRLDGSFSLGPIQMHRQ